MADQFSNDQPHEQIDKPKTVAEIAALLTGMESNLPVHPTDPSLQTGLRVLRLFDAVLGGTPGYVITFTVGAVGLEPLRVDVVNGVDDEAKITAAQALIGRGGECIGFADFAAGAGTETAVVYRRGLAPAENDTDAGQIGTVIQNPQHNFLNRLQALNPQVQSGMGLAGLAQGGLQIVRNAAGDGALIMVTDCDIDTDGPGGSREKDPCWLPDTSLHDAAGKPCDSRTFPGVVVPPEITATFGVRMGDFAFVFHEDKAVACQVYDGGPRHKIGEVSVGLAWAAGVPPVPPVGATPQQRDQVESRAARRGNNVRNLVTLIFPGSSPHRAVDTATIQTSANQLLQALTS